MLAIKGNFDAALGLVKEITSKYPITLVNSINPFAWRARRPRPLRSAKGWGGRPDYQCIPVGNAGNITAYWKGYKEYKQEAKIKFLPKMLGFQAAGPLLLLKDIP